MIMLKSFTLEPLAHLFNDLLSFLKLCETVMRQVGTLSRLKSIPIGLCHATFPCSAHIIRIKHRNGNQK